jgi:hypothetical protein
MMPQQTRIRMMMVIPAKGRPMPVDGAFDDEPMLKSPKLSVKSILECSVKND